MQSTHLLVQNNAVNQMINLLGGLTWRTYLEDLLGGLTWRTYLDDLLGGLTWRTYLGDLLGGLTWSRFEVAKTAPWPTRGLHHFGKFLEPSDE